MLLRPGETCWRIEKATRIAVLVDNAAFFAAARAALKKARRSILLLAWQFDPQTQLDPTEEKPETIGALLNELQARRPDLDIRILVWDASYAVAAAFRFFPQRAPAFLDPRISLHLDHAHPPGACHHQKVLVIDDALAFCSGDDFMPDRWDEPSHQDWHPGRGGGIWGQFPPHHGATMMVDGDAAGALGDLFRHRWQRATGEALAAVTPQIDPWPASVTPDLRDHEVAIIRTMPGEEGNGSIREGEAWYLEAIASARRFIYIENQYLTSPRIGDALAERLAEPDGPEIVVVLAPHAPSYFDRFIMDAARDGLVAALNRADAHGRFRAYAPRSRGKLPITVHSKIAIIDGRTLRIGSTNLNNRSLGFDTECDLALEADDERDGEAVRGLSRTLGHRLLAHFIGCDEGVFATEFERQGRLIGAIEALDGPKRRLQPLRPKGSGAIGGLSAAHHLGDPESPDDSLKPWARSHGPSRFPLKRIVLPALVAIAALAAWRLTRR